MIDADSNPGLAFAAGIEPARAGGMKTLFELRESWIPGEVTPRALVERFSYNTPGGVPLITMARVNGADRGCLCRAHTLVREVTDVLGREEQLITFIDTAAGLEYLQRGTVQFIETLLVVAEPYYRSLETAARIKGLADELNIKHIYGIANKVRDRVDEQVILEYFKKCGIKLLACVPFYQHIGESRTQVESKVLAQILSQIELDYRAHVLGSHFFALSEKLLLSSNVELSQRELLTLRYLGRKGQLTMKELAKSIRAALSTTTSIVDKLVAKHYVERVSKEADRRIIYVRLSGTGKEWLKEHINASETMVKEMTRSLDRSEQNKLIALMKKIQLS